MMTTEERWRRACGRVAEERVRPIALEDGSYLVASSRVPGHGYRVFADPQSPTISCNCPAGSWEFPCKHAEAVRLVMLASAGHAELQRAS